MSEHLDDLADLVDDIFATQTANPWHTLAQSGLTQLTSSGAGWPEVAVLLRSAGAHAVSLPIAENDVLAKPFLAALDDTALGADPDAIRTVAVLGATGAARHVPFARDVERLVVAWPVEERWLAADVPATDVVIEPADNHAGEPRDHIRIDLSAVDGVEIDVSLVTDLRYRGALARALAIAGALETVVTTVVQHTTARIQFGRPIAKFQAVQALAATVAGEAALARAAADAATDSVAAGHPDARFAVAAAASCAGHAAGTAARAAHQALGAIGFTREHDLHRYTTRALSWRSDYGTVRSWDAELASTAIDLGGEGLWRTIVG